NRISLPPPIASLPKSSNLSTSQPRANSVNTAETLIVGCVKSAPTTNRARLPKGSRAQGGSHSMVRHRPGRTRHTLQIVSTFALLFPAADTARPQIQTIEAENQPTPFRMTVSAAPEPQPALKYRFLVPPVDQIQGNAATYYYKALAYSGF